MSTAEKYFRNEWWDMVTVDREREKQLAREQKEVYEEMILQECLEGRKTYPKIAAEYKVCVPTVYRLLKRSKA